MQEKNKSCRSPAQLGLAARSPCLGHYQQQGRDWTTSLLQLQELMGFLPSTGYSCSRGRHEKIPPRTQNKRSKLHKQLMNSELTWKKIVKFVEDSLDKKEQQSVSGDLRTILQAAKQIVGTENGQEAIESGAVFLFKTFHMKECVGHEETKAIKQMFGPFPSSSATAACSATSRIASYFTEEQLTALIQIAEEQNGDNRVFFGKNIVFSFDMHDLDRSEELPINGEAAEQKTISLDYNKFLNNHLEHFQNCYGDNSDLKSLEKVDDSFLWYEVGKFLNESLKGTPGEPTTDDLCCTLYEMLASSKSGDELQNEVQ
ncbi:Activating signal cointegrator 1 complex subunit 3 [Chelonia mydas]|uniref:Activating signal cointegrator 1 complex subunit 3 n=1 Tax=Chelonia mydas TaxID=8469 RepID=M7BN55_CHEMY|nr:Activating signal cointegrator 1 complex subunit 3 [Chelonia mydas]